MEDLNIFTPKARARYPHLTNPDAFQGVSKYKCDLMFDPANPEHSQFIAAVRKYETGAKKEIVEVAQAELDDLDANSKNPAIIKKIKALQVLVSDIDTEFNSPLKEEFDKDTGEPTGLYILRSSSKSSFIDKKTKAVINIAPKLYDATGNIISGDRPQIGGGSELIMKVKLRGYSESFGCGLSSQIQAVQIIKLFEGGGGSDDGFSAVAGGGYVAPKAETFSDSDSMAY